MPTRQKILRALAIAAGLFVAIQLVPYGRAHENPPIDGEPAWPSPEAKALAVRACFDCHSRNTTWPWYSFVAPVSWMVQHHVDEGRAELDFTAWNQPQRHAKDAARVVEKGEMPLGSYLPAHPEARLTEAERATLVAALKQIAGARD